MSLREFARKFIRAKIYTNKECTKEGHFSFNDEIYVQTDGVMMGSPLGSLIANIFMCELENNMVPTLDSLEEWTRYVDDTLTLIHPKSIQTVL